MGTCAKGDIIKAVAQAGFPHALSEALVEAVIAIIKETLESGEDVLVSGFGKFRVRSKKARTGRNPATGKSMTLEPRKVVTFHCSGNLRKKLNP